MTVSEALLSQKQRFTDPGIGTCRHTQKGPNTSMMRGQNSCGRAPAFHAASCNRSWPHCSCEKVRSVLLMMQMRRPGWSILASMSFLPIARTTQASTAPSSISRALWKQPRSSISKPCLCTLALCLPHWSIYPTALPRLHNGGCRYDGEYLTRGWQYLTRATRVAVVDQGGSI